MVHGASHIGDSPLHLAIETKQAGVISLLLRAGADPTMRNKNGRSPLDNLGMYEQSPAVLQHRPCSGRACLSCTHARARARAHARREKEKQRGGGGDTYLSSLM